MPLPTPELGLVVHYGFVWRRTTRSPPDAGKDRPCLIVRLRQDEVAGQRVLRVTYLPVSHVAPRTDEQAVTVPPRVASHLGLTSEQSYLYLSYAVEDDWPFDLAHLPGSRDRFHYGLAPPRFFADIATRFADYLADHPRSTHRR